MKMYIENFKTGEHELTDGVDGEWNDYIPQDHAVQNYYVCLRALKYEPTQAAAITLSRITGDTELADKLEEEYKPV